MLSERREAIARGIAETVSQLGLEAGKNVIDVLKRATPAFLPRAARVNVCVNCLRALMTFAVVVCTSRDRPGETPESLDKACTDDVVMAIAIFAGRTTMLRGPGSTSHLAVARLARADFEKLTGRKVPPELRPLYGEALDG